MPGGPGTGQSSTPNSLESLVRAAEKDDLLLYLTAFCGVVMPGCVYVLYHYIHKMYSEYSKVRLRAAFNTTFVDFKDLL